MAHSPGTPSEKDKMDNHSSKNDRSASPEVAESTVTYGNLMKKDLSWLGTLAVGYNINSSWLAIAISMTISVSYGPMNSIWGLLLAMPVYTAIGLTLAELVSAYPTTGGQYHWSAIIAPRRISAAASYFCGFVGWFSWMTFGAASMIAATPIIATMVMNDYHDFEVQGWHKYLMYMFLNTLSTLVNLFGKKFVSRIYSMGFILSLISFVVMSITAISMAQVRQSSEVVWLSYTTEWSGWPAGIQFLIALAAPVVAFCPIDATSHLVEEVKDAPKTVPRTIIASLGVSFATSLVFLLTTLYSVSDFDAVLAVTTGYPLFTIWQQATGTDVIPKVFSSILIVLVLIGGIGVCQVVSMLSWSLGRDGAFLFGGHLGRMHTGLNAPVYALLLNYVVIALLGTLNLFSALAFNSIAGIAGVMQQITVAIPTAMLLYQRRSPEFLPPSRTFCLPDWAGWLCNIVAFLWTIITTVFFLFPSTTTPNTETMNYAIVVVGGVSVIALINWFAFARHRFSGPSKIEFHH